MSSYRLDPAAAPGGTTIRSPVRDLQSRCDYGRHGLAARAMFLAAALLVAGVCGPRPVSAENLVVQGSTTFTTRLMTPYKAMIEAASGHTLDVIPSKSVFGLLALLEGRAHLAMISTGLDTEISLLRQTKPGLPVERLRSFEIARTRAGFAVHPSNPVRTASLQTLQRILLGEIANWRELGGPDLPIRVVVVRDGGGVQMSVEAQLLGNRPIAAPDTIRVQQGPQVVKVVEQEPGALGLAPLSLMRARQLPDLVTDGVIEQELNIVSLGEPSAAMRAVIEAMRRIAADQLAEATDRNR